MRYAVVCLLVGCVYAAPVAAPGPVRVVEPVITSGDSGPPWSGSWSAKGEQRSEAVTASDVKGGGSAVSSPSFAPPVAAHQFHPGAGNGVRHVGGGVAGR